MDFIPKPFTPSELKSSIDLITNEFQRAGRYEGGVSLVMIDVDHFKLFNDHYGHRAGDDCLRKVATSLRENIRRAGDLVARYGGEEFAVLLPETPQEGAFILAERLREKLASTCFNYGEQAIYVTMSIGIAAYSASQGFGSWRR